MRLLLPLLLAAPLAGCGLGNALIGFPPGEEDCFPNEVAFFNIGPGFEDNINSELFDGDCSRILPLNGCDSETGPNAVVSVGLQNDGEPVDVEVVANYTFDGVLAAAFDADDPIDSCLASNDDDGDTNRSRVTFRMETFDFVSVLFSSLSGDDGPFNATIRVLP